MQNDQLNPVMEFRKSVWEALSVFSQRTGILIETIEIIHVNVSAFPNETNWIKDKIELHFKPGVYR